MKLYALCCILILASMACNRPSSDYDVTVVGDGQNLGDLSAAPTPMGGVVEYTRMRLLGDNLGLGVTGLYGDQPSASGSSWVMGTAQFGYPKTEAFDRTSNLLTPAVAGPKGADRCITITGGRTSPGATEGVDVGDTIRLVGNGFQATLPRDPTYYPRPAGEEWYVAYGVGIQPVLIDHPSLPDNWRPGSGVTLSYPGTLPPDYSTLGSVPLPGEAPVSLPNDLTDLLVDGEPLTATRRVTGPWKDPTTFSWTPLQEPEALTVSLRVLGDGAEGSCECGEDCGPGYTCDEGVCIGNDGANWNQLGEIVCHVEDDGAFELEPSHVSQLLEWLGASNSSGAVLSVSRMRQSTFNVPPVLTHNDRRVDINPIRIRTTDAVFTRVERAP